MANTDTEMPSSGASGDTGACRRCRARPAIQRADTAINMVWNNAASASALPWPKR